MLCLLFPQVRPTQNQDFTSKMNSMIWKIFLQHFHLRESGKCLFYCLWLLYLQLAFWKRLATYFRCLEAERSLCFLFGSLKCYTTRLPYWIIFSSRNSSVSHLRPGFNLKVITFGQSSEALRSRRGLGGFWGNWFSLVADASLGQMRNQTTAPFAEKPTSAV